MALIETLEAALGKATPGPWTKQHGGQTWWIASCGIGEDGMTLWSANPPTPDHGGEREDDGGAADVANATLIAEAVNALPRLLAVVRAAQGAIDGRLYVDSGRIAALRVALAALDTEGER